MSRGEGLSYQCEAAQTVLQQAMVGVMQSGVTFHENSSYSEHTACNESECLDANLTKMHELDPACDVCPCDSAHVPMNLTKEVLLQHAWQQQLQDVRPSVIILKTSINHSVYNLQRWPFAK